ncbi:unnamed protein product [Withania somnifera]
MSGIMVSADVLGRRMFSAGGSGGNGGGGGGGGLLSIGGSLGEASGGTRIGGGLLGDKGIGFGGGGH